MGQRRGACYYNHSNSAVTPTTPTISLDTPPPTPTKPLLSPLYTTFRMVDKTPSKAADEAAAAAAVVSSLDDSDNDSGVDVGNEYVDRKHFRKRRRTNTVTDTTTMTTATTTTTTSATTTTTPIMPFGMEQLHVNNHHHQSMMYGTPTSACVPPFEGIHYEINHWVEHSLTFADQQRPQPWIAPMQRPTTNTTSYKRQHPITIHLDDEEVTQKYLHFEDDEEEHHPTHNNNNTNNLMLTTSLNSNDLSFNTTLYPSHSLPPPQQQPSPYPSMSLQPHYQLSQFVSMQDILYSWIKVNTCLFKSIVIVSFRARHSSTLFFARAFIYMKSFRSIFEAAKHVV